jgi:hypothetical protein
VWKAVELKPGGEDETVTIHNVEDYIERTIGIYTYLIVARMQLCIFSCIVASPRVSVSDIWNYFFPPPSFLYRLWNLVFGLKVDDNEKRKAMFSHFFPSLKPECSWTDFGWNTTKERKLIFDCYKSRASIYVFSC